MLKSLLALVAIMGLNGTAFAAACPTEIAKSHAIDFINETQRRDGLQPTEVLTLTVADHLRNVTTVVFTYTQQRAQDAHPRVYLGRAEYSNDCDNYMFSSAQVK